LILRPQWAIYFVSPAMPPGLQARLWAERVTRFSARINRPRGTDTATNGTDKAMKGPDEAAKGTDKALKGTDKALKGTYKALKGTDKALKGPNGLHPADLSETVAVKRMSRMSDARPRSISRPSTVTSMLPPLPAGHAAVQRSAAQRGAQRCGAVRRGPVQCSAVQCSAVQCHALPRPAVLGGATLVARRAAMQRPCRYVVRRMRRRVACGASRDARVRRSARGRRAR
jgi:hypothetical protein